MPAHLQLLFVINLFHDFTIRWEWVLKRKSFNLKFAFMVALYVWLHCKGSAFVLPEISRARSCFSTRCFRLL